MFEESESVFSGTGNGSTSGLGESFLNDDFFSNSGFPPSTRGSSNLGGIGDRGSMSPFEAGDSFLTSQQMRSASPTPQQRHEEYSDRPGEDGQENMTQRASSPKPFHDHAATATAPTSTANNNGPSSGRNDDGGQEKSRSGEQSGATDSSDGSPRDSDSRNQSKTAEAPSHGAQSSSEHQHASRAEERGESPDRGTGNSTPKPRDSHTVSGDSGSRGAHKGDTASEENSRADNQDKSKAGAPVSSTTHLRRADAGTKADRTPPNSSQSTHKRSKLLPNELSMMDALWHSVRESQTILDHVQQHYR